LAPKDTRPSTDKPRGVDYPNGMNKWIWLTVRLAITALAATEGALNGDNWLPARPVTALWLLGWVAYGVIAVPVVVWAQRLNPRNKPVWHFPAWTRNPLTLRDPMQFFHMIGFVFLAAGLGVAGRALWSAEMLRIAHVVVPAVGVGIIAGSYVAARLFRQQLEGRAQESVP
jgi:hypothetical protein